MPYTPLSEAERQRVVRAWIDSTHFHSAPRVDTACPAPARPPRRRWHRAQQAAFLRARFTPHTGTQPASPALRTSFYGASRARRLSQFSCVSRSTQQALQSTPLANSARRAQGCVAGIAHYECGSSVQAAASPLAATLLYLSPYPLRPRCVRALNSTRVRTLYCIGFNICYTARKLTWSLR